MTKTLNATQLTLGLCEWANSVNNPNTATVSGGKGSWFQRSANGAATPTEIYLNLFGTTTGWVKQNLININVYNVVSFGAVGNGVTDDRAAIQAAIDACVASGTFGIVYFPATSAYYKISSKITSSASFNLANKTQICFLGDGYASKLKLESNSALGTWYMWHIHDGSNELSWINLYFDTAGVALADEQTHVFNPSSETTDTHGGCNQLKWINCYWGPSVGDGVRFIGALPAIPTFNHLIKYNAFDMEGSRAPIGGQRNTERIRVYYNWLTGSNDQNIDFEATGTGTPANWTFYGNIIDAQNKGVQTATLGGQGTAPSNQISFLCNQIHRGGDVFVIDSHRLKFHGNIILITAAAGAGSGTSIELQDGIVECQVTGNIMDAPGATKNVNGIFLTSSTHSPQNNLMANNLIKAYGDSLGGSNIFMEESPDSAVNGNLLENVNANVGKGSPIIFRTITHSLDGLMASGNLIISSSAAAKAGITFGVTTGFTLGNALAVGNFVKNAANAVRWDDSASTGTFIDWRGALWTLGVSITAQPVFVPPSQNVGATIEGNPGPAARVVLFDNATSPMAGTGGVPSPVGSLATNISGGDATTLWYKDAASSPTDVTGWSSIGPAQLEFAAQSLTTTLTALFLASGMDLANAISTEIQMPVPRAGTIRAMRLSCVAGTGGGNVTLTVRKNGVDTALVLTVANTSTSGSSSSGSFTVAAGDLISISVVKSGVISTSQTMADVVLEFA